MSMCVGRFSEFGNLCINVSDINEILFENLNYVKSYKSDLAYDITGLMKSIAINKNTKIDSFVNGNHNSFWDYEDDNGVFHHLIGFRNCGVDCASFICYRYNSKEYINVYDITMKILCNGEVHMDIVNVKDYSKTYLQGIFDKIINEIERP